jgi:hypothetical protein
VVDAMNLMMHDNCYGISKRRVTLSTSGVVPALDRLSQYTDACLAISLHAPNDELRNQLVPINKKYPIAMLLASAKRYIEAMPDTHRKITIEYTLIDHVNDRPEHARELAELLRDVPVKINLIPFNPFNLSDYKRVSNNALRRFQEILMAEGYITTVRTTRGDDIDAACGQLAGEVNDITRRSERHRARSGDREVVHRAVDRELADRPAREAQGPDDERVGREGEGRAVDADERGIPKRGERRVLEQGDDHALHELAARLPAGAVRHGDALVGEARPPAAHVLDALDDLGLGELLGHQTSTCRRFFA